jgi:hypothetical protein
MLRTMGAYLRTAIAAIVVAIGVSIPAYASGLTVEQVVGLSRAGVTDAIILALIDRDKTIFAIEPEQIVKLQREGVSEPVILAMLKSGRAEGDEAARADAADTAAFIASRLAPGPELVIVGHGPERPDVPQHSFYASPPQTFVLPVPYGAYGTPYGTSYGPSYGMSYEGPSIGSSMHHHRLPPSFGTRRFSEPRELCYAQVNTARSTSPLTYVTECPAVMQPRRIR